MIGYPAAYDVERPRVDRPQARPRRGLPRHQSAAITYGWLVETSTAAPSPYSRTEGKGKGNGQAGQSPAPASGVGQGSTRRMEMLGDSVLQMGMMGSVPGLGDWSFRGRGTGGDGANEEGIREANGPTLRRRGSIAPGEPLPGPALAAPANRPRGNGTFGYSSDP